MTEFDPIAYLKAQQNARQESLRQNTRIENDLFATLSQKKDKAHPVFDMLSSKFKDSVAWSRATLKAKLSQDLDAVIGEQFVKHADLKDEAYIAIIKDKKYRVAVVSRQDVAKSTDSTLQDQILLDMNPVGFFAPGEFKLQTKDDPAYEDMQKALNTFFEKNQATFDYLQKTSEGLES